MYPISFGISVGFERWTRYGSHRFFGRKDEQLVSEFELRRQSTQLLSLLAAAQSGAKTLTKYLHHFLLQTKSKLPTKIMVIRGGFKVPRPRKWEGPEGYLRCGHRFSNQPRARSHPGLRQRRKARVQTGSLSQTRRYVFFESLVNYGRPEFTIKASRDGRIILSSALLSSFIWVLISPSSYIQRLIHICV